MKYVASAADEKPSSKGWIKMTTLLECYKILEQYPDSMTKDQFYRIAHISKRHAKYLLDSGLVPCHDSGKKTRRYTIQTRDVVTFLCDREDNPDKYKAPKRLYIGNSGKAKRRRSTTEIIRFHFTEPEKTGLYKEWERLAADYNDLLTTSDVTELTGYSAQSIQRWCNQKILVGFQIRGKLLVPRLSIIEFMAGNRATAIARKSPKHLELLRTYAQECHEGAMTITY